MAGREEGEGGQGHYLPPEPGGLEPDLGPAAAPASETQPHQPPPQGGWQPPQHAQQPPPAHAPYAPQQQTGWTPPPQGWYPPPPQPQQSQPWGYGPTPQPWGYQAPPQPDNGAAVAGFSLAVAGGVLLLLTAGLSSIVSMVCAGLGIFYSLRGRRRVDRGETPKHRSLAQAGFVTGIVTLVLAVLATAFWALFGILYATDEGFRQDLEDGSGGSSDGFQTSVRVMAALGRAAWALAS